MGKSSNGVVKTILKVISVVFLPTIFIGILLFALNQSFGVGLTVIVSSLVVQFMLSRKYRDSFHWNTYEHFRFWGLTGEIKFYKTLNILFNATKVATVLGILRLVYLNYSEILNPFGSLGITIFVCLTIIGILIISLSSYNRRGNYLRAYEKVRGNLAIVVVLMVVSFVYLTFGTQLIWIPFLAMLAFSLFDGCGEIEEVLNIDENNLHIGSLLVILLTAIISSTIQFWDGIANFFMTIWAFLVKVGMYEFIPGGYVWVVFLVIAVLAIIIILARYQGRRDRAKREYLRIQNETKEILAKEKLQREEQSKDRKIREEEEKQKEKLFVEKTWKEIAALEEVLEKRDITMKELLHISSVYSRFDCLSRFKVKHLTAIPLKDYFVISLVKKQIVWPASFTSLINMYGFLYSKNYYDGDLKLIISILNDLLTYLGEYKEFTGYKEMEKLIQKTEIPLTWEK